MRRVAFVEVVVAVLVGAFWLLATRESTQAEASATKAIEPTPGFQPAMCPYFAA